MRKNAKKNEKTKKNTCSRKRDNFNQDYDGRNRYSMVCAYLHIYHRHKVARFDLSGINQQPTDITFTYQMHTLLLWSMDYSSSVRCTMHDALWYIEDIVAAAR